MVINLSRDEFIDYMKVLEDYYWRTRRLADVFGVDELYGMTELMDLSVGLVSEPFKDVLVENPVSEGTNLLTHFCWTMEFGANGENPIIDGVVYEVSSAGELYDLLIQIEEKRMIEMIKKIKGAIAYGVEPIDIMKQSGCYMD